MSTPKKVTVVKEVKGKVDSKNPASKKGNLVHLQDKERLIKQSFRNPLNRGEILQKEFKAIDFEVDTRHDTNGKEIHGGVIMYVEETFNHLSVDPRRSSGYARSHETHVRTYPLNEFVRAAILKYCQDIGGEFTIDPKDMTPSLVFLLLKNINAKFIEQRFSHMLVDGRNNQLAGRLKTKRMDALLESFSELKVGNSIIKAKNILHIPLFDKNLKFEDI